MGVPKKRTSRQKRDSRRAHWKATAPNVSACPKCGEPILPHRACPKCGEYKGRAVQKGAED
jgi:large subunit ribosomal protein L32